MSLRPAQFLGNQPCEIVRTTKFTGPGRRLAGQEHEDQDRFFRLLGSRVAVDQLVRGGANVRERVVRDRLGNREKLSGR